MHGASMGGISSTNLVLSGKIPVLVQTGFCPVLDTYNEIFLHPWSNGLPKTALSVGVGTVCDSKQVMLLISGHNKARALRHCIEGGVDHAWTISALQLHKDGIIACDEPACGELKVDTYKYFKEIYKNEI